MEDRSIKHKDDHVDSMEDSIEDRPDTPPVGGVMIPGEGCRPEDDEFQQDKKNEEKSLEGTSARSDEPSEPTEDEVPEDKEDSLDATIASVVKSGPSAPTPPKRQPVNGRKCSNCQTEETEQWYRYGTGNFLCSRCGQHYRRAGKHAPLQKGQKRNYDGPICVNCRTTETDVWRYDKRGPICNPCYKYLDKYKVDRPIKATAPGEVGEDPSQDAGASSSVASELTEDEVPQNEDSSEGTSADIRLSSTVVKTPKRPNQSVNGRKCFICETEDTAVWHRGATGKYWCDECCQVLKIHAIPRKKKFSQSANGRRCSNCGIEETSMWRRDPTGGYLCNACGQFLDKYGIRQPLETKRPPRKSKYYSAVCINCEATKTSHWKNTERGLLCIACAMHLKNHKVDRPLSMKQETVKTRQRKVKKTTAPGNGEPEMADTMTKDTRDTVESSNDDSEMMPDSSDEDV